MLIDSNGSHINYRLVIVVVLLAVFALINMSCNISCAEKKDISKIAERNARLLLHKYDLHPTGKPKTTEFNKKQREYDSYKYFFKIENEVSNKIGLNLAKYENQKLDTLSFKLKERAQSYPGDVTAIFKFDNKGTIRGASLGLNGYIPGIVALNDRAFLMPESLKPDKLTFKNLKKIDVFGSFDENGGGWGTSATISNPKDISNLTAMFERSTPRKGSPEWPKMGEEICRIAIYYKDGPVVYANLYSQNSHDILKLDPFHKQYFEPPEELKANIIKLLEQE